MGYRDVEVVTGDDAVPKNTTLQLTVGDHRVKFATITEEQQSGDPLVRIFVGVANSEDFEVRNELSVLALRSPYRIVNGVIGEPHVLALATCSHQFGPVLLRYQMQKGTAATKTLQRLLAQIRHAETQSVENVMAFSAAAQTHYTVARQLMQEAQNYVNSSAFVHAGDVLFRLGDTGEPPYFHVTAVGEPDRRTLLEHGRLLVTLTGVYHDRPDVLPPDSLGKATTMKATTHGDNLARCTGLHRDGYPKWGMDIIFVAPGTTSILPDAGMCALRTIRGAQ